jgi:4-hydroxy-tetrahydrodipicolinate synthase
MASSKASTYVISLTPFDGRGQIDEQAFRVHLRRFAEAGIGVYVAGGGSGEAYALAPDETRRVLEIAAEELRGKVPVRAMGTEPRTAKQMIEFGRMVEVAGLDTMQVYSLDAGHGVKPTARELERYYSDVLEEVPIQAVLSTHQSVGYTIPLDILERLLAKYPRLIGINCTHFDIGYLVAVVDLCRDRAEVHVGGTQQALAVLALGGTGYLTSEGNLAPRTCVAVTDHWQAGRFAEAHDAFSVVLHLYSANSKFGSIRGIKAALQILGLPGGEPRPPRLAVSDVERQEIAQTLDALNIRGLEAIK